MPKVKPSQDIQPLSTFRANAASLVQQVRETKRPLVLTQHGRSAAVVLDVEEYEAMVEEIELLRDVRQAEYELDSGQGIDSDAAEARLRARVLK
jgi:prevent-host-death family protein